MICQLVCHSLQHCQFFLGISVADDTGAAQSSSDDDTALLAGILGGIGGIVFAVLLCTLACIIFFCILWHQRKRVKKGKQSFPYCECFSSKDNNNYC